MRVLYMMVILVLANAAFCSTTNKNPLIERRLRHGVEFMTALNVCKTGSCGSNVVTSIKLPETLRTGKWSFDLKLREDTIGGNLGSQERNFKIGESRMFSLVEQSPSNLVATTACVALFDDDATARLMAFGAERGYFSAPVEAIVDFFVVKEHEDIVLFTMKDTIPIPNAASRICAVYKNVCVSFFFIEKDFQSGRQEMILDLLRLCCPEAATAIDRGGFQSCAGQKH